MGNTCNNCTKNNKEEDGYEGMVARNKDIYKFKNDLELLLDATPNYYIPVVEEGSVGNLTKTRNKLLRSETQKKKEEKKEESSPLEPLEPPMQSESEENNGQSERFGSQNDELVERISGTGRSNARRNRLQHNKTMNEEFTEKVKEVPGLHPEKEELEMVVEYLKNHFVFGSMAQEALYEIGKKMWLCQSTEEYIMKQGDESAMCFFILKEGKAVVEIDNQQRKNLSRGDGFGDLALLYNAPRSASIRCISECTFWAIERKNFKQVIEDRIISQYESNREFLNSIRFFDSMTNEQKDAVAGMLIRESFVPNQTICRKGDQANTYYMIVKGTVRCMLGSKVVRKLGKGDTFGEQALYMNSVRNLTVEAVDHVDLMSITREDLINSMGGHLQDMIFSNYIRWAFDKDSTFSEISPIVREKLVQNFQFINKRKNEMLILKRSVQSKLLIILEGEACCSKKNMETKFKKGFLFNAKYFNNKSGTKVPKNTVYMEADGVVGEIDFQNMRDIIASFETINKEMPEIASRRERVREETNTKGKTVDDYEFMKYLGKGQFGHVYCIKSKTGRLLALKVMSKLQIYDQGLERHVLQEKSVLDVCDHPFIVKKHSTMKDNENIYFLLEMIQGMELFDVIRKIGFLSNSEAKFYTSSLLLAIEYLHGLGIVYRDLKPENVMVDYEGYIKLVDMGTGKKLEQKNGGSLRTTTIIGTPHYMAPEVFLGRGYSFPVDLWSIGICLFEFMCGFLPFGENANDPYEVYRQIQCQKLIFPGHFMNKKNLYAKFVIDKLLSRVPESRLGTSFASLKSQKWFDDVNWSNLIQKKMNPPFIPDNRQIVPEKKVLVSQRIRVHSNHFEIDSQLIRMTKGNTYPKARLKKKKTAICFRT